MQDFRVSSFSCLDFQCTHSNDNWWQSLRNGSELFMRLSLGGSIAEPLEYPLSHVLHQMSIVCQLLFFKPHHFRRAQSRNSTYNSVSLASLAWETSYVLESIKKFSRDTVHDFCCLQAVSGHQPILPIQEPLKACQTIVLAPSKLTRSSCLSA